MQHLGGYLQDIIDICFGVSPRKVSYLARRIGVLTSCEQWTVYHFNPKYLKHPGEPSAETRIAPWTGKSMCCKFQQQKKTPHHIRYMCRRMSRSHYLFLNVVLFGCFQKSILGYPYFWKHPFEGTRIQACFSMNEPSSTRAMSFKPKTCQVHQEWQTCWQYQRLKKTAHAMPDTSTLCTNKCQLWIISDALWFARGWNQSGLLPMISTTFDKETNDWGDNAYFDLLRSSRTRTCTKAKLKEAVQNQETLMFGYVWYIWCHCHAMDGQQDHPQNI